MSLFFRRASGSEQRAVSMVDWGTGADLDASMGSLSATLAVVPVFAATRLITDGIATLPLQQYRKLADGSRQDMPLAGVFGHHGRRIQWIQQALTSLLVRGNAYGWATSYGPGGNVVWLHPDHVQVDESKSLPVYRYNGVEIPSDQVRHIAAYTLPGSVVGVSPIGACALLASTGTSTQKMMADWFKNRALPGATFQNTEMALMTPEAKKVSDGLQARLRNGKPLVFGKDWKFEPVTMSASDAAFIDAAKLNATQIASIYGVPPEKIGGESGSSLTYSTVELNALNLAQETLRPWASKLEEEFSAWLSGPQFVKFNMDAGIRVDTKTRYEVHQIARNIGLNNTDELRALEDLQPLPDGLGEDYTPLAKPASPAAPKETR